MAIHGSMMGDETKAECVCKCPVHAPTSKPNGDKSGRQTLNPFPLQQQHVHGWANLVIFLAITFIVTRLTVNYYDETRLVDLDLFVDTFLTRQFVEVMCVFALLGAVHTMIALALGRLAQKYELSPSSLMLAVYATLGPVYVCGLIMLYMTTRFQIVPTSAIFVEHTVICMKTYSYGMTQVHRREKGLPIAICSFLGWIWFLWTPQLVFQNHWFEKSFQLNESTRWWVVGEKALVGSLAFVVMYILAVEDINPVLCQTHTTPPIKAIAQLGIPLLCFQLCLWFFVFECICEAFAELTRFPDDERDFYQDWWNSSTYLEFNRKWNRPVHKFLHEHVYKRSLSGNWSKQFAAFNTFFFSAVMHEILFILIFDVVKFYFLLLMMIQIPIIMLSKPLQGTMLGNFIFWFGPSAGVPLQAVLYTRESFGGESGFLSVMVPIVSISLFGFFVIDRCSQTNRLMKDKPS